MGVIAAGTGWTFETIDDQPDWLQELVYAIIITDKQLNNAYQESMIKIWNKKH